MLKYAAATRRYARGLRQILHDTVDPAEARRRIALRLAEREASFLDTLARGTYANPRSPYLKLLHHAGIELGDIRQLVAEGGVEGALEELYEAGVYVTSAETKARQPIRRGSLEFQPRESDFDNPLAEAAFEGRTSGSSGTPTRVFIGFDLMHFEAPYYACLLEGHGLQGMPLALWHAALQTALKTTFKHAGANRRPEAWWMSSRFDWTTEAWKREYIVNLTLLLSRLFGRPLPRPRSLPRGDVGPVMGWLAGKTAASTPALLETNPSTAVRICLAALKSGSDINGTAFHVVGEPMTSAKTEVIASAGARAIDRYANVEVGIIALACARPDGSDDLHLVSDKLALIHHRKNVPGLAEPIDALAFSTLSPTTPKLWLNVENGDYASLSRRDCGCVFGEMGFDTHLSGVRAFDKLTSEGLTIPFSDLVDLVEGVLPARFGGGPTDYQLFEEEENGVPKVSIAVRPSVGEIDEAALVATALDVLRKTSGVVDRAHEWGSAGTLRVVRRDPFETHSAKIMPLHVVRGGS